MRLRCSRCAKCISTEVPDTTIVRAYLTCPECIVEENRDQEIADAIGNPFIEGEE